MRVFVYNLFELDIRCETILYESKTGRQINVFRVTVVSTLVNVFFIVLIPFWKEKAYDYYC